MYPKERRRTFPEIETERLFLGEISVEDAEIILKHFSDGEILKYMDFDVLTTREAAEEIIRWGKNLFVTGMGILWGIYKKDAFIGTLTYEHTIEDDDNIYSTEVTYDLARQYWGKGYMAEAMKSTLDYIFFKENINRIGTRVHIQNFRSASALIKAGFQLEGILRDYWFLNGKMTDVMIFSMLKRDWQKSR